MLSQPPDDRHCFSYRYFSLFARWPTRVGGVGPLPFTRFRSLTIPRLQCLASFPAALTEHCSRVRFIAVRINNLTCRNWSYHMESVHHPKWIIGTQMVWSLSASSTFTERCKSTVPTCLYEFVKVQIVLYKHREPRLTGLIGWQTIKINRSSMDNHGIRENKRDCIFCATITLIFLDMHSLLWYNLLFSFMIARKKNIWSIGLLDRDSNLGLQLARKMLPRLSYPGCRLILSS